jgi:hypothetical protein
LLKGGKYTAKTPNFEAERHWPMLLKYLGPARVQDTSGNKQRQHIMKIKIKIKIKIKRKIKRKINKKQK